MSWPFATSWKTKRDAKLAQRSTDLQRGADALGDRINVSLKEDLPYLSATASEIVRKITNDKEWTATRVLEAFIRAALRAQDSVNCLVCATCGM
jgi:amidase